MLKKGNVFWITGLAGAGKTTLGKQLFSYIKKTKNNIVILDGDELRKAFGNTFGYSKEERFKCAMCYSNLCKLLSDQGVDIICCTISMFHEVRCWNRDNIENYMEIYVDTPIEIIKKRNQKNLYSDVINGNIQNVIGIDLEVELPMNPDLVLVNDTVQPIEEIIAEIANKALEKFGEL